MITDNQLQQIMPTLNSQKRQMFLPFLNHIMPMFGINSPMREAAFLAQIAHESGELKFFEEIWGPTSAQKRYEPPSDLAKRLGNTQPGDGKRYKGRGPIQITGRFNYRKYGQLLNLDLEGNPDLAATTQVGFQTACQFWKQNGLNELADIPDFTTITKRINGGFNGQADREKYYARAKQALGIAASPASFSFSFASVAETPSDEPFTHALPRGQEAIEQLSGNTSTTGSTKAESKKKSAAKLAKKAAGKSVKAAKKVAAKPVAKKAAKKAPVKAAKKAVKKAPVKAAKKAVKKAPVKAAKKAIKKAPVKAAKKAVKKAPAKPAKKAAKKTARKK
ncbi:MAG: glycoside hydrolase family 19 protein [Blastocatellia bacterium]